MRLRTFGVQLNDVAVIGRRTMDDHVDVVREAFESKLLAFTGRRRGSGPKRPLRPRCLI
jgi:hypothetical protein